MAGFRSGLKSLSYVLAGALTGFAGPKKGEAAVLMYHAVDDSGWRLSITPTEFELQLRFLKEKRVVVSLADVVAFAEGSKNLPQGAVAITFDDGYADLVPNVLPLLKRYNLPITLFLNTDVAAKTNSLGLPRVSWDDVKKLKESNLVTIESHCRTHPHLPWLSPVDVKAELEGAQQDLERELGSRAPYFAYPYGDRSPDVEKAVAEAGHTAAFAITEGFVRKGSNLLRLPRIQVDATMTPFLFGVRLTPALTMNRRIVDGCRRVLGKYSK